MSFRGLVCVAFVAALLTLVGCQEEKAAPQGETTIMQTTVVSGSLSATTANSMASSNSTTVLDDVTSQSGSDATTESTTSSTTAKTTAVTTKPTTQKTTATTKKTTTKTTKPTTKKTTTTTKKTTATTTKPTTKKTTTTTKKTTATTTKPTTTKTTTTTKQTTTKTTVTTTKPTTTTTTTTRHIINTDNVAWYLILANSENQLPSSYEVTDAIIKGGEYPKTYRYSLDERIVDIWNQMYDDAKADGVTLTAISTYRSISDQSILFERKKKEYLNQGYSDSAAEALAAKSVMYPGCSDHNLGLGVDICSLEQSWENSEEFQWLSEHAEDYGFVLRYPKNKVNITKVKYEPWHWRYVGVAAAKEMNELGMCLEEYHIYKGFVQ